MTLQDNAKAELARLIKEIGHYEALLRKAPEGVLRCHKNGDYYKWFRAVKDPDGREVRTYIPRAEAAFARELAKSTLYKKKLARLRSEARVISRFLNDFYSIKSQPLEIDGLSSGFRQLLFCDEALPDMKDELREWQSAPYTRNPYHPEGLTIRAAGNIFVRSKSEAFIASALTQHAIPYRYECGLEIGHTMYYPDFTIRHPVSGQTYLWEHFGLVDKPAYLENMLSKLRAYTAAGYVPFDSLIMTFETSERPLSFSLVENLIQYYFL